MMLARWLSSNHKTVRSGVAILILRKCYVNVNYHTKY